MPIHSASSRKKLLEVHPDLQRVVHAVAQRVNLLVVCGHRGKNDQNSAFLTGKSKLTWPHSKHNKMPSHAIDLAPLDENGKLSWDRLDLFDELGKIMLEEAEKLGIEIAWGGHWKSFVDRPHFELSSNTEKDPSSVG